MRNLAGATIAHTDAYIEDELSEACITTERTVPSGGEVKTTLIGKEGDFTFTRAWYYWVVNGPVSLDVAQAMYEDPRGREDVRVDGHCGCPEPKERVVLYHIDSQDGLNLFAEKVLGTRPLPPTEEDKKVALWIAREVEELPGDGQRPCVFTEALDLLERIYGHGCAPGSEQCVALENFLVEHGRVRDTEREHEPSKEMT